jgi:hypothetical protein
MDMNEHVANRNRFPAEELARYAGKYVAWSLDGTRILAHGDDLEEVAQVLGAGGHRSRDAVISYVTGPEELILGGAPGGEEG